MASIAAADATLPARGIFCKPIAITKIVTSTGQRLPVESAGCKRVMSQAVADAEFDGVLDGLLEVFLGVIAFTLASLLLVDLGLNWPELTTRRS